MVQVPVPYGDAEKISIRAAEIARADIVGRGWSQRAVDSIVADPKEGMVGLRSSEQYMMYQDKGFGPFVMWWAEGRAQPLDSKILTPAGWKAMGDIKVGDKVIDPMTGNSSVVEGVFPQGKKEIYKISLSDDSCTEASEDHLWTVSIQGMRKNQYVWTTKKIQDFLLHKNTQSVSWNYPVRVPAIQAINYEPQSELPIPPYTLGALLGDGSIAHRRVSIHSIDKEILYRIEQELPDSMSLNYAGGITYRLAKRPGTGKTNPYIQHLKALGLSHNCYTKYIPQQYKTASVEERIALLQGLFDTDGSCDSQGRSEFSSVSRQLAMDVQEVIRSLGGRCAVGTKDSPVFSANGVGKTGQTQYRLQNVNIPFNIFYLTRKAERFVERDSRSYRRIASIESVGAKEAQCIKVSAPSQMYITDDFIPTHNTIPIHDASGTHYVTGKDVGKPGWVTLPGGVKKFKQVRWQHPGLEPKNFLENAITQAIKEGKPSIKDKLLNIVKGMGIWQ